MIFNYTSQFGATNILCKNKLIMTPSSKRNTYPLMSSLYVIRSLVFSLKPICNFRGQKWDREKQIKGLLLEMWIRNKKKFVLLNVRDVVLLRSPRKEILPDSLRRQYTTNPFSKVFILIYFIFNSSIWREDGKKC